MEFKDITTAQVRKLTNLLVEMGMWTGDIKQTATTNWKYNLTVKSERTAKACVEILRTDFRKKLQKIVK